MRNKNSLQSQIEDEKKRNKHTHNINCMLSGDCNRGDKQNGNECKE